MWLISKNVEENVFWWTSRMGFGVLRVARGGSGAARPGCQISASFDGSPRTYQKYFLGTPQNFNQVFT